MPAGGPSEQVQAMTRGLAAFSRGDNEACVAEMDPEIEWHITFQLPDFPPGQPVFRGHEEVRAALEAVQSAFDVLTLDLEEILYESEGILIIRVRFHGRGAASGVEVERRLYYVQEMRNAKLLRQQPFDTEDEAFRAAGVERD